MKYFQVFVNEASRDKRLVASKTRDAAVEGTGATSIKFNEREYRRIYQRRWSRRAREVGVIYEDTCRSGIW